MYKKVSASNKSIAHRLFFQHFESYLKRFKIHLQIGTFDKKLFLHGKATRVSANVFTNETPVSPTK